MKKELKKDIFLLILQTLFDDNSRDISRENCISFYHFLIDTLDKEVIAIPDDEEEDISLCFSILELLCNFDVLGEGSISWDSGTIIAFLIDYSGLNPNEFNTSISKFRKIYTFIKEDFILGLT
ncbi:MAG: hypothetical protein AABY15_06105 [Nanoarchaeota archaeon]